MLLIIAKYIPANLVPALLAFAAVYVFTRHLSPVEFGDYTFAFSAALLVTSTLFNALPTVVMQMLPAAEIAGQRGELLATAYQLLSVALVGLALASLLVLVPSVRDGVPAAFWLAMPLAGFRGIIAINQSINQLDNRVRTYSVIECLQSLIGFGAATALVLLRGPSATNLMLGYMIAAAGCVLIDTRASRFGFARGEFNRALAGQIMRLSAPMILTSLAATLLLYSDRFALQILAPAGELGLYAVAAALIERPLSTLSVTIATALYPLAVRAIGYHGASAGQTQFSRNLLAMVSVTLPACVGLALLAHPISGVLVGAEFRAGAEALIPFFAVVVFFRSLATHGLDHAFYLSLQPGRMLAIYAPVAVLDVVLVAVGAWYYGVYGTLAAGLVCALLLTALEWRAVARIFPLHIKLGTLSRIMIATAGMTLAVHFTHTPVSWLGLLASISVGVLCYGTLFVMLDILDIRTESGRRIGQWRHARSAART